MGSEDTQNYSIKVITAPMEEDSTLLDLSNYLSERELLGNEMLLSIPYFGVNVFGSMNGGGPIRVFNYTDLKTNDQYIGTNLIASEVLLSDIFGEGSTYKTNPIADLEGRIAALEGTS